MPEVEVRRPERQGDERVREQAQRLRPAEREHAAGGSARSARRAAERREVAEQDVLEHVEGEELARSPNACDRRDEREEHERDPGREERRRRQRGTGGRAAAQRPRPRAVGTARERRAARAGAGRAPSSSAATACRPQRSRSHQDLSSTPVQLFHYHLVTSKVREVEARYIGKLGFDLVARYGRIGEDHRRSRPASRGTSSTAGFKLRLTELERGARQRRRPARPVGAAARRPPRGRARRGRVRGRRSARARRSSCASRSTAAGGRSSRRAPATGSSCTRRASGSTSCSRRRSSFALGELQLLADDPEPKAAALGELLDLGTEDDTVRRSSAEHGRALRRAGGPQGRPRARTASCFPSAASSVQVESAASRRRLAP